MHIGDRIKEIRERRGKTLLQVAEFLNVREATAQRYESGEIKNLKLDTITKIAKFLNVHPNYLMGWEEDDRSLTDLSARYNYYPVDISAGALTVADSVSEYNVQKISIPDSLMGKYAGDEKIFITRVNGESMNNRFPDNSLIAVKPVEASLLKDGDIVVFSNEDYEYSVKRFFRDDTRLIFKPDSRFEYFTDYVTTIDDNNLTIHGKVILYIVELD